MEQQLAESLIAGGQKLVYARHMGGPYFLCRYPQSNDLNFKLSVIPSWKWRPEHMGFRIHYLDLPILEAEAALAGYTLEYSDVEVLKKIKGNYLERRAWRNSDKPDVYAGIIDSYVQRGKQLPNLTPPMNRPLADKQLAGARFMWRTKRALNCDGMGCISGDAEIIVNRGGGARRYTLRDAYLRFNGLAAKKDNWKLPSHTRSLDGDRFSLNRIVGIVSKGQKRVLRITTESGRQIVATPDHVFFTPGGEREIGSMSVGDELLVNGRPLCSICGEDRKLSGGKFAGVCRTCIYRQLRHSANKGAGERVDKDGYVTVQAGVKYHPCVRSHGIYKHRLVYEAAMNGLSYSAYMARLRVGDIAGFQFLNRLQIIHHKDEIKTHNMYPNLEIETPSGHAKEHSGKNTLNLWNVKGPKAERIVCIVPAGVTDVYDVMMEAPRHSFIVNGFVVHNSGKSYQAIAAVILNKINGTPYKTLILCPTSVKGSWAKEVAFAGGLSCVILDSSLAKRTEQLNGEALNADIVICSFEGFNSDYLELGALGFNILIVDEVHRISNRENNLTQRLIGGKKIKKTFVHIAKPHSIYLLTGTPISNKLDDIYPMLALLDPGILSWIGFLNRYTVREAGQRWEARLNRYTGKKEKFLREYMQVVGYKNEKELKAKLSLYMIRRTKDEMLPNLPPKSFKTIDVTLSEEERKVYEDLRRDFRAQIRGKDIAVKSQLDWMMRAQQICDSLEIVQDSKAKKSSKMEALIKLVESKSKDHKVIIFSRFKEMTDIIVRDLVHLNPCHFHGELADKKRQPIIDAFQEDEKRRVFVSTIQAGGVGITLHAGDVVILYDIWWAPGMNFQAIDRSHRRGQTKPVTAYFFNVLDSFEQHVLAVCMRKQALIQNIVGDEAVIADLLKDVPREMLI